MALQGLWVYKIATFYLSLKEVLHTLFYETVSFHGLASLLSKSNKQNCNIPFLGNHLALYALLALFCFQKAST